MRKDFDDLMRRIEAMHRGKKRVVLNDKKSLLKDCYRELSLELDNEKAILIEKEDAITICIEGEQIMISEETGMKKELLDWADFTEIRAEGTKAVVELWFRCWEWE